MFSHDSYDVAHITRLSYHARHEYAWNEPQRRGDWRSLGTTCFTLCRV